MSREEPLVGHPRFRKLKSLAKGTFGTVVLAHDAQTDRLVAIKFMPRGPQIGKYVERELINHRLLQHPHVIKLKEVFLTRFHLGIVLEYADGGDCYDYVVRNGHLNEQQARWIFQQLIVAVDYLHRRGVSNRDIKLENVLLVGNPERPLVKMCDLGYAKHEELQSAPDSKVGTPAYLAPEVITTPKGATYDGKKADIWSCGVMLYVMLCGAYPFERSVDKSDPPNKKLAKMIQRIVRVDYVFPEDATPSPECADLLGRLMVADPDKRATLEDIMTHPWYTRNLPPGVVDMNKKLKPVHCIQTDEEVMAILTEARTLEPGDDVVLTEKQIDEMIASKSRSGSL